MTDETLVHTRIGKANLLFYNQPNSSIGGLMTELLYQTDSYIQEFDATVKTVLQEERAVILDQTAFYPGGGGQPCDLGTLTIEGKTYPVGKVKKSGEDVLHVVAGDEALPATGRLHECLIRLTLQ